MNIDQGHGIRIGDAQIIIKDVRFSRTGNSATLAIRADVAQKISKITAIE
jgi:hypothetical protein